MIVYKKTYMKALMKLRRNVQHQVKKKKKPKLLSHVVWPYYRIIRQLPAKVCEPFSEGELAGSASRLSGNILRLDLL